MVKGEKSTHRSECNASRGQANQTAIPRMRLIDSKGILYTELLNDILNLLPVLDDDKIPYHPL